MIGPGRAADIVIRDATPDDLAEITRIYAHHVVTGLASFEETAPDEQEHLNRYRRILDRGLPYIVAELDSGVRGYAYAMTYRERSAYRYTVENSIYVDTDWVRRGIASALMGPLIDRCAAAGMRQMIAVIGDSANQGSIGLHTSHGFRMAGTLPAVGYKFGRWVDSVIMTRPLGDGDRTGPSQAT